MCRSYKVQGSSYGTVSKSISIVELLSSFINFFNLKAALKYWKQYDSSHFGGKLMFSLLFTFFIFQLQSPNICILKMYILQKKCNNLFFSVIFQNCVPVMFFFYFVLYIYIYIYIYFSKLTLDQLKINKLNKINKFQITWSITWFLWFYRNILLGHSCLLSKFNVPNKDKSPWKHQKPLSASFSCL